MTTIKALIVHSLRTKINSCAKNSQKYIVFNVQHKYTYLWRLVCIRERKEKALAKKKCPLCDGDGQAYCWVCDGDCEVDDEDEDGNTIKVVCKTCGGSGRKGMCYPCQGTGQI